MFLAIWRGARSIDELSKLAGVRGGANPEGERVAWIPSASDDRDPDTLSAAEFYTSAGVTDVQRHVKQMYLASDGGAEVGDPRSGRDARDADRPAARRRDARRRSCRGRLVLGASAPIADACNREAMRLLAASLPAIRRDPRIWKRGLTAQQGMWLSRIGTMAGITNGASHGIGYLLGGGRGIAHGITSCVTLPAVFTWNASVNAARQAQVSEAFGGAGEPAGEVLRRFISSLGQPTRLRHVGIAHDDLPEIAESWDGTGPIATNPRPVRGKDDLLEILELAY
jgi:maleylacetate reductase